MNGDAGLERLGAVPVAQASSLHEASTLRNRRRMIRMRRLARSPDRQARRLRYGRGRQETIPRIRLPNRRMDISAD